MTDAPRSLLDWVEKLHTRWSARLKAVCSVADRCDSAKAYEIQNFLADIEQLQRLVAACPLPREEPDDLQQLVEQWRLRARQLTRAPAKPMTLYPKSYNQGRAEQLEADARELEGLVAASPIPRAEESAALRQRARHVTERLRHTQHDIIEPFCADARIRSAGGPMEEAYHAGGIDRAVELIDELLAVLDGSAPVSPEEP